MRIKDEDEIEWLHTYFDIASVVNIQWNELLELLILGPTLSNYFISI